MPRFYIPQALSIGTVVSLPEHITHHIHVLRLAVGEAITLFNGEGGEFTATMQTIERKRAVAEVKAFSPREAELPYALMLAQALPEGSKMDWIIEKAVELGATAIQPIAAQRCVVRLSSERAAKKYEHWKNIIVAASEQCGRNRLAHLAEAEPFTQWIGQSDLHPRILLSPRATQSLSDWARHHPPQCVSLLIGPEGGFTEEEENMALHQGALSLSIGQRVLRTETAGIAAISAVNAVWGEL
jgi:16S rRNA (uracil1498-N3)-methyltransferase